MDLLGVSRVRFTAQYLIFPNAKRGFSTTLEGSSSLCSTVVLRRFSKLSKMSTLDTRRPPGVQPADPGGFRRKRAEEDPEFLLFPEFPEFLEFALFLLFAEFLGSGFKMGWRNRVIG